MTGSFVSKKSKSSDIAVIGLSVWYPGSSSLTEFWENILAKRQQFRQMPDCRLPKAEYHHHDKNVPDKTYGQEAAVIDGFDYDWQARRVPKKTFESTDIVHWLALEVALKALDDAQVNIKKLQEIQTGVILGNTLTGEWTRTNAMRLRWPFMAKVIRETALNRGLSPEAIDDLVKHAEYAFKSVFPQINEDTLAGALSNTIAGRICNVLDLHGGGYTVDGACSSSLLAVETAAQHLASGSLDVALAGGIDISLDTFELIGFAKTGALTPDEMRVYDKRANGFIPGEGCGFVVLKRLEEAQRDQDRIYAVIKGWGLSSDGKGGLTAPSVQGQAHAIRKAYDMAGYKVSDLHFVEGHGTGTTLGDKVEISALNTALGKEVPPSKIALTSLKSIIGHTKAAAGIGALIKATIAVNQRVIPPLAGVEDPNELFETEAVHFYPEMHGRVMDEKSTLRAGVSAMGFGGINTHMTLESYGTPAEHLRPSVPEEILLGSHDRSEAVIFTAPTQTALGRLITNAMTEAMGISRSELQDFAYEKSRLIRNEDKFRAVIVVKNPVDLLLGLSIVEEFLKAPLQVGEVKEKHDTKLYAAAAHKKENPRIGFMFPGQGSQKRRMGLDIIKRHPWAQEKVRQAQALVGESFDFLELIESGKSNGKVLKDTEVAQPALSLVNAIAFELLVKSGVKPHATAGHSLGELSALYGTQAIDFKQLINLSQYRGSVMSASHEDAGSMAYLSTSKQVVEGLIQDLAQSDSDGYLTIANHNSPDQVVVSGDPSMIERIVEAAKNKGIPSGKLQVSNAFHSRYMESGAEQMAVHLDSMDFAKPRLPFVMGSQGQWMEEGSDLKAYLTRQITDPVDFVSSFDTLARECDLVIEVGSGSVLTNLAKKMLPTDRSFRVLSTFANPGQDFDYKITLGVCFALGVNIRWSEVFAHRFFRPFVPVRERSFIASPTEKPLSFLEERKDHQSLLGQIAWNSSQEGYQGYKTDRSPVGAGFNLTPMMGAGEPAKFHTPLTQGDPSHLPGGTQGVPAKAQLLISRQGSEENQRVQSILDTIYSEISNLTGFDRNTLNPEMKLLDDLHLDSIKSTEFIGNISMQYNVASELANLHLANIKLSELAALIMQYSPSNQVQSNDALVSQRSASISAHVPTPVSPPLPFETTPPAASQKLSIAQHPTPVTPPSEMPVLTPSTSVAAPQAPTGSSPASLIQKRSEHSEVLPASPGSSGTAQSRAKTREPWTRNFSEIFVPAPVEMPVNFTPWLLEKILVVAPHAQDFEVVFPKHELEKANSQVETLFMDQDQKSALNLAPYGTVIVMMDELEDNFGSLSQSVQILSLITRSKFARNQKVVFIQNDDGQFGQKNPSKVGAKAFAQSLAHERPDLAIRVLSFHRTSRSTWSVIDVLSQELLLPQKLVVAAYNEEGERFVPELQLDKTATYVKRTTTWGPSDVILVTGGAKGITAECAFHFAKKHRVKVVLLGSSAAIKGVENQTLHPISAILNRYLEEGLTAQYVSCDITDQGQVNATIKKAQEIFGPITGIIHGAGINHPKLLQSVELSAALREVSPKAQGILNMISAIDPKQLKMIIALTSVIGVVGMPGNGWYGFANENLDLLLRRLRLQNPNLWVQSLAYSVWSEIGMGARLGSDKALEEKGITAIPPSEGVARFLMLSEYEGRDQQTVITSRLGSVKLSA